jgi:Glycosyl hydrolase catalytic core
MNLLKCRLATIACIAIIALSACGGGGSDDSSTSAVDNSVQNRQKNTNLSTSPSGTTIPPASQIVDNSKNIWTVKQSVVYENGALAGYTANVALLLFYNGAIYHENTSGNWWEWQNGTWNSVPGDPRTTTTTTTTTTTSSKSIWYGIGGHVNQGGAYANTTFATQGAQLKDLGFTLYRQDLWDAAGASNVKTLATAVQPYGVQVLPVITTDVSSYTSESTAYSAGYSLAQTVAQTLKGYVAGYELGNELDNFAIVSGDGNAPTDYDNTRFQVVRGLLRGMIDGIHSVDTTTKVAISSSGWLHYAFDEMLWNGTQPDGTSGHPTARWDITSWHWYSDMGSITNACGGSGCHNVVQQLQSDFGKPIWLTEYGFRPDGSDTDAGNYIVSAMSTYNSIAKQYNIQSISLYELYDDQIYGGDGNYGLLLSDGVTPKVDYSQVKSFIASNSAPF